MTKNSLPENWQLTTIGEITLPIEKVDPSKNPNQTIAYLDISGIDNKSNVVIEAKNYLGKDAPSRARQLIKQGDILFSTVRTYLKNIAVVPAQFNGQVASTGFSILRAAEDINSKLLFYYTLTPDFLNPLADLQRGSSYPAVRDDDVRIQRFPLAPANEQKRIVAKIEELFSELDKGIENLKTASEQLKVYRQAVLKHAFEGKLTATWREKNKDKLQPVDQLLERMKQERDAHHNALMSDYNKASKTGEKRAKPRKPVEVRSFSSEDFSWLSALPQGWAWERLGWMTCGIEYGTGAKSSESGTVPVLRMGNIQNMKFDWSDLVYTSDAEEINDYLLRTEDVLFNRTNSPELVGKTAIYNGERPAIFAGYLMRINQINSIVDARYLNFYLNSHTAKQYGNTVKTDGVNQSNINGEKLAHYPFPYCSLEEQKIVVEFLESQISQIDRTEADIDSQIQKAEALRQSILKKAFSGQLVAQTPNDEPASVLLERIRSEKFGQEISKKTLTKKWKVA